MRQRGSIICSHSQTVGGLFVDDLKQYPLGRNPSPFDNRDYDLRSFIPIVKHEIELTEKMWEFPSGPLDQGDSSHCIGFAAADWGINLPTNTNFTNDDGHRFYYECKEIEGQPGEENGAYIRSIGKVLKANKHLEAYAFAPDINTIKYWLLYKGPIIAGTIWTEGMFTPDENNVIHPTGSSMGGHAYLLNEWRVDDYIGIQNSWGESWGKNGKAYISKEDFERIFSRGGEALAAVEIIKQPQQVTEKKCWLVEFFKKIFS